MQRSRDIGFGVTLGCCSERGGSELFQSSLHYDASDISLYVDSLNDVSCIILGGRRPPHSVVVDARSRRHRPVGRQKSRQLLGDKTGPYSCLGAQLAAAREAHSDLGGARATDVQRLLFLDRQQVTLIS